MAVSRFRSFLLVLGLSCVALASSKVSDCGDASFSGKFASLLLTPLTPVRGEPVVLSGNGTLSKQITAGSGTAVVSLNGAAIFKAEVATCGHTSVPLPLGLGSVSVDALQCPTPPNNGTLRLGVNVNLPAIAPQGSYDIQLVALDQNNLNTFCVDAQFDL